MRLRNKKVIQLVSNDDDMINAGAIWDEEAAVADGNIVSSRRPPDLPDYM